MRYLHLREKAIEKSDVNLRDLFDALTYRGLWAFLESTRACVIRSCAGHSARTCFANRSKNSFRKSPSHDFEPGGAGVRAQAVASSGELVQDFCIQRFRNSIHILNAPSPAATASLAIGEEIVNQMMVN